MSFLSKFIGDITGSNQAKNRQKDLESALGEYQTSLGGQGDTLRKLLDTLRREAGVNQQNQLRARYQAQEQLAQQLAQQKALAAQENQSLIDRLMSQVTGQLDTSEASQRKAFADATNADLGVQLPAFEAFFGSRGHDINSPAIRAAIADAVAKNKVRGLDLESSLANQRLGALNNIFGQQASMSREDLIQQRQNELNRFLENLGFRTQNYNTAQNYGNALNFSAPLDLEQSILEFQRGGNAQKVNVASQAAQNAQQRQQGIEQGLGSLAGNVGLNLLFPASNVTKLLGAVKGGIPFSNQYMDFLGTLGRA